MALALRLVLIVVGSVSVFLGLAGVLLGLYTLGGLLRKGDVGLAFWTLVLMAGAGGLIWIGRLAILDRVSEL